MEFKLRVMLGILVIVFTGCNGKNSSNEAMPITMDNIKLYSQKKSQASQSVSLGDSVVDKVIKTYKIPLDDMGYNFDITILATTKVLNKAPYNQLSVYTYGILNDVMQYVKMYPQESVDKGFVEVETRDKILSYLKYSEFNENIIQALKYVRQCQQINNGICSARQYSKILLDNKFIDPEVDTKKLEKMFGKNMSQHIASQNTTLTDTRLTGLFHSKVGNASEFGKYIEDKNGNQINVVFLFSEYTKPFKLKDNVQEAIDGYNPWWTK